MRKLIKEGLVALVLSLGVTAPVSAGPFEDAVAAYDRGDYVAAHRLFRPLADQGDALAQFNLGLMYANGQGVPQNDAEAFGWFRSAADQGLADAQYNLGLMYLNGKSPLNMFVSDPKSADVVKKIHYASAVEWFRKAADQGHALAQYNLGSMYLSGQGVPQDYAEAVKWYRKAADQGFAPAQYNLGLMYDNGQGVPQDYVQAHKWLNLAVSRYPASDKENRDRAVRVRDRTAAKMTPAQIAEAQRLAREWKPQ